MDRHGMRLTFSKEWTREEAEAYIAGFQRGLDDPLTDMDRALRRRFRGRVVPEEQPEFAEVPAAS